MRTRPGSFAPVTYVIGRECVDVMEKSCVQECPVDCIYEGARTMYINPDECVDCGACKLACRHEAIYWEGDLPDDEVAHRDDSAAFFQLTLPGRGAPLGCPGGASTVGRVGVDTPLVAALPAKP
jgi:NAD-dependent dihydropyrimidine dehydrogenase PreA subunit